MASESLCYFRSREVAILGFTELFSTSHPALVYFWNSVPLFFHFSSFSSICSSNLSLSKQVCGYNNLTRDLAISNSVFAHLLLLSLLNSHFR